MKKSLRKKLLDDYSHLFDEKSPPTFDCGDGWAKPLRSLLQELHETPRPEGCTITTIKQKYARLTVYCQPSNPNIRDLLDRWADASTNYCETCGSTDDTDFMEHEGYERAACPICRKKILAGWKPENPEFSAEEKLAARAILGALSAKLDEELEALFPEGTAVLTLRSHPGKCEILIQDAEDRTYAITI